MRLALTLAALLFAAPAFAVTGNAPPATGWAARPIVMLIDARGDLCTGTAIARDLVLTAAHCVTLPIEYRARLFQKGATIAVRSVARHPHFSMAAYAANRATADVALVKLSAPLPEIVVPAALAAARRVAGGEVMTIAGFGVTRAGTALGLGVPRAAQLTVTGKPGSLQIRLVDAKTLTNGRALAAAPAIPARRSMTASALW